VGTLGRKIGRERRGRRREGRKGKDTNTSFFLLPANQVQRHNDSVFMDFNRQTFVAINAIETAGNYFACDSWTVLIK